MRSENSAEPVGGVPLAPGEPPRCRYVGISGVMGAGKTHLARELEAALLRAGVPAYRRSLAGPLKQVCATLFGFTPEQLHTAEGKAQVDPRWGISPRQALQHLGTEGVRKGMGQSLVAAGLWQPHEAEDFWVRALLIATQALPAGSVVLVDDVRFRNEADALQACDGTRLLRIELSRSDCDAGAAQHASETGLSGPEHAALWAATYTREPAGDLVHTRGLTHAALLSELTRWSAERRGEVHT